METIAIQKQELKTLIRETLDEYFPKYNEISDSEQLEIENLYADDNFKKSMNSNVSIL